ncbi:MAG: FHA domain-containing protein [Myxococcota bacterium]|jgi:pSer/pThr/pTyr-binding forkhead associated (FHA) protein|nr:FHA domain-containing protein [Myxococcota bacterium]
MAKRGGFDDEAEFKKKGATMSLDVDKLDLPDRSARGGKAGGGKASGRAAGWGGGARRDDDDDEPLRKPKSGGGSSKGGGGFSKGGTASFNVADMDLDDPGKGRPGKGGWGPARGGAKKPHDDDDDDLRPPKKTSGRRDSAAKLDDAGEVQSDFHDWAAAKPKGGDPSPAGDDAPAKLVIREPGKQDRTFPLRLKSRSITLGREVSCDVVLSDIKASRQHCEITFLAGAFSLKDLGSGNGTKVDGEKVTKIQLRNGMVIAIGECQITFELDEGALARALEREGPPGRKRNQAANEEEEEEEPPRRLSGLAMALVALLVLATVGFAATVVVWLVSKPDKRPSGAKVVELEELPKEDPAIRAAEQATATAMTTAAEGYSGTGKLWEARRLAAIALLVNPGQEGAKSLLGQTERALKSQKTEACKVLVEPTNPRRGGQVTIRAQLNGPVASVSGTFLDTKLDFTPDPQLPMSWVASFKAPAKTGGGAQPLHLAIVDLLDDTLELQQEVTVR